MSKDVCYIHDGPQREISNPADVDAFLQSSAFKKLFEFLEKVNDTIRNKKISECGLDMDQSARVVIDLLTDMRLTTKSFPPLDVNSRFGNPAFQQWYDAVCSLIYEKLEPVIQDKEYLVEACEYLTHSLGNRSRIDFGTGHEAHFLAFMYCLVELKVCRLNDQLFVMFLAYLRMMRIVQATYWLEPAGSLGVWGLDDYHFLPFLLGSSQLYDHPHLTPKSIQDADVRDAFKDEYLYYDAIDSIVFIKGPHLYQHSPMIDDISAVKVWSKVNTGLLKMYRAEVFSKLPVMQHFLFGRLISFKGSGGKDIGEPTHQHRGDCCGNALPSAFPAATGRDNIRNLTSIPFD